MGNLVKLAENAGGGWLPFLKIAGAQSVTIANITLPHYDSQLTITDLLLPPRLLLSSVVNTEFRYGTESAATHTLIAKALEGLNAIWKNKEITMSTRSVQRFG